jgi:hypothetical protein
LVTPIANGSIPACGTAQWASNCRKTYVTTCAGNLASEMPGLNEESQLYLGQNFPNPSNGNAVIDYFLPEKYAGSVIDIYSLNGKIISRISCTIGQGSTEINVRNWPAGIYYYSLNHFGTKLDSKKFVVIE